MRSRRGGRYRWSRRGVREDRSLWSVNRLTHRERALQRLPGWIVALLGPFPDEVGWGNVFAKWTVFGGFTGLSLQQLEFTENPWPVVFYGVSVLLFLIAMLTA